ncbi:hypothetical protein Hanom_Chr11g01041351 [Helianthus anomalus]
MVVAAILVEKKGVGLGGVILFCLLIGGPPELNYNFSLLFYVSFVIIRVFL